MLTLIGEETDWETDALVGTGCEHIQVGTEFKIGTTGGGIATFSKFNRKNFTQRIVGGGYWLSLKLSP